MQKQNADYARIERALQETGVVAILRGIGQPALGYMLEALYAGGIQLAEVTLNSPDAPGAIRAARAAWEGRMFIGAGTVLDAAQAEISLEAGAQFIVTPNIHEEVILRCRADGVLIAPGALTPTEIAHAMRLGCRYVKIFPVRAMGETYLRDVLAPLNNARLIAVGGVDAGNIAGYVKQGAVGAGVGGNLCKVPADGNYATITALARDMVAAYRQAKGLG